MFLVEGESRGTQLVEHASFAVGFFSGTDPSTVEDEQVRELHPLIFGDEFHEVLFDFVLILIFSESQSLGESMDMGVNGDACGYPVSVEKDDVGGFPRDSWDLYQLFHGVRNFAMVFLNEEAATVLDVLGFVMVETCGADILLQFLEIGVGVVLGGAVLFEEHLGNLVDLFVSGLCGQYRSDQELKWVGVVESDFSVWVLFLEELNDFGCTFFGFEVDLGVLQNLHHNWTARSRYFKVDLNPLAAFLPSENI
jgi:hypothetical protein